MFNAYTPPTTYDEANKTAKKIVSEMTLDEKVSMIGGHNLFFTQGLERFGVPTLYFSDASQGVNIRSELDDQLNQSVAFPCSMALASTWNTELTQAYAQSIGEECRAGEIAVLLGPGMNIYRVSQNGRNFEYLGEDPFLVSRIVENYVVGMQSTGTIATLKHFVANNSDFKRRTSNSVVDERTLREIYLPAFEAGINAGAMAVMTSYNQVNGEYTAQSKELITDLLRNDLGYKWLVMSDWWSIWDSEKAIKSGLDLDMPGEPRDEYPEYTKKSDFFLRQSAKSLLEEKKIELADIDNMVTNLLTTIIAMGLLDRPVKDTSYLEHFDQHIEVALQTARESIVLLKNDGVLPIDHSTKSTILLTGEYVNKIPFGGGAAEVEGYDQVTVFEALRTLFGDRIIFIARPSDEEIKNSSHVIYCAGTFDSEGWDKSFDFPDNINRDIKHICELNSNIIVSVSSGSGMNMSEWNDDVAAIIYNWYPGQIGFKALAEIIAGLTNPSAKLPITIEKSFEDSPGADYLPEGAELYTGWDEDHNILEPTHDVVYSEGVFVGYRWYESQQIEPLYAFGHGLSYTSYRYSHLRLKKTSIKLGSTVYFSLDVENIGEVDGQEIIQIYVRDIEASVPRPSKELKAFQKVNLKAGAKQTIEFSLSNRDLSFWDVTSKSWKAEPGEFEILAATASDKILEKAIFQIV